MFHSRRLSALISSAASPPKRTLEKEPSFQTSMWRISPGPVPPISYLLKPCLYDLERTPWRTSSILGGWGRKGLHFQVISWVMKLLWWDSALWLEKYYSEVILDQRLHCRECASFVFFFFKLSRVWSFIYTSLRLEVAGYVTTHITQT